MELQYDYKDWQLWRFTCDCKDPGCCLDLNITIEDLDRSQPMIAVGIHQSFTNSLWKRIKDALKYVFKGESYCLGEIILQEKDKKDLVELLERYSCQKRS